MRLTIRQHAAYLKYVLRHKAYVYLAGRMIGLTRWRCFAHDLSKFLPSEWSAYADAFYAPDGSGRYKEAHEFDLAWNAHQKRNKHHWQYWLLTMDSGKQEAMPMPNVYVLEMLADWIGAGVAINGYCNLRSWYAEQTGCIGLHTQTRFAVEQFIKDHCSSNCDLCPIGFFFSVLRGLPILKKPIVCGPFKRPANV